VDSLHKAMRASLSKARATVKKKDRQKVGVELLAERARLGLDLWTGEPLAKTDLAKVGPKE
jgi:hypothetical protein